MRWLCGLVVIGQVVFAFAIEHASPTLRDPEYGERESRLRSLAARYPGAPLYVAFGSSRLAAGLRPAVLERASPKDAVVFNFGLIGAGPVYQRLALERAIRAGIKPDMVLVEFWPPYLFKSGGQSEQERFDRSRLNHADEVIITDYWRGAGDWLQHLVPSYSHRFTMLNQVVPNWLPFQNRREFYWTPLDEFGWLPGKPSRNRIPQLEQAHHYYGPILSSYSIDPIGIRAFEDLFAVCRERGIEVGLIWLPESSEFRSWYSAAANRLADKLLDMLSRRVGVHVIDARSWVADDRLGDGFHLDPDGAVEFTKRLRTEIAKLVQGEATQ